MGKRKILEIGPYPPPNSGWSVRIRYLKKGFVEAGHQCQILNLGKNRRTKSPEYVDIQNGFDYLLKLFTFRLRGYHFHLHMNGQAIKGPILSLAGVIISMLTLERPTLTLHGGIKQLYFPKENGKKMYGVIYLNFLLSKLIVCNNEAIKNEIARYGPFIRKQKIYPIPAFSVQYLRFQKVELPDKIQEFIQSKHQVILCYIVLRNGFFIETLIEFIERLKSDIGIILTGIREIEDEEISHLSERLQAFAENGTLLTVPNLNHDQFMTLLAKSDIYLRTPVSDGVASSVMEALSVKVPVVASENGKRPCGVITYKPGNVDDLESKVAWVLKNVQDVKKNIVRPTVRDTVRDEVDLIVGMKR